MAIVNRGDFQATDPQPPYPQATLWYSIDDTDNDIQEVWCDNPTTKTARLVVKRSDGTGQPPPPLQWAPGDTTRYAVGQGAQSRLRLQVGNGGKLGGVDIDFRLI